MAENNITQRQLINSICDGVEARIRPLFEDLYVVVAAIGARLEVLEKTSGAKRPLRSEHKTGATAAAQPDSNDPHDRIKNSMLYTRRMWADDESFRIKYHSAPVQVEIDNDKKKSVVDESDGSNDQKTEDTKRRIDELNELELIYFLDNIHILKLFFRKNQV